MCGTWRRLGVVVLRLGHQVCKVSLYSPEHLHVLFGSHVGLLPFVLQLCHLLRTYGTALTLGLKTMNFLQQVHVNVQQ